MLFDGVPNLSQIGQIGIFGLHVDFIFRAERIHAKRLYQILAGVFLPLRQRLFLGDELHFCRIRGCLELLVEFGYLVRRGIAPENDADAHVFFQVGRNVASHDAEESNNSRQHQYQRDTDRRCHIRLEIGYFRFFFFSHVPANTVFAPRDKRQIRLADHAETQLFADKDTTTNTRLSNILRFFQQIVKIARMCNRTHRRWHKN